MENKASELCWFFCAYESTSGQIYTHHEVDFSVVFWGEGGAQILNTGTPLTTPIGIHTPCFYKPFNTNYYYFTKRRKQQRKNNVYTEEPLSVCKGFMYKGHNSTRYPSGKRYLQVLHFSYD